MKKQTLNNIAKRFFLGSLVAAMFFLSANATTVNNKFWDIDPTSKKAEIKFVGSSSDNLFFNVKYTNETGSTFKVFVLDENGETLFQERYTDKVFDKKFMFPGNPDISKLTFLVQTEKGSYKEIFDVKVTTKMVAEVTKKN
jgi:hypothetical protein